MLQVIVQVTKYLLLLIMIFFTLETYMVLWRKNEDARLRIMRKQIWLMIAFNFTAYFVMFLQSQDWNMPLIFGGISLYILAVQILYRLIYRNASLILLNTMCMLLSVGFVIQSRLGIRTAVKQLVIVSAATLLCFIIPVFIRRVHFVSRLSWIYAVLGIALLAVVFLYGRRSGGANLNLKIMGISFQFSEFVKITYVFFLAGMLQRAANFKQVVLVSVIAGMHVIILVLSKDLGAALIYFVAYIVMVCVATRQPAYALVGLGGMAGASVLAYKLFSHVRVRVQVWQDPFADYQSSGYQIVQGLFAICAGGWFGTGLFNGHPEMIPLAIEDFTFAAICEEMGVIFAICLILLCMGMYLLIVMIAMRLDRPFYKLTALGLGTEYAFQVFLTIGGTTKFIPMTGITLPLVSYGGSSIMCTIIMISIVQGLYIMRRDEDEEFQDELEYREMLRRRAALREREEARYQAAQEQETLSGTRMSRRAQKRLQEEQRRAQEQQRRAQEERRRTQEQQRTSREQQRRAQADRPSGWNTSEDTIPRSRQSSRYAEDDRRAERLQETRIWTPGQSGEENYAARQRNGRLTDRGEYLPKQESDYPSPRRPQEGSGKRPDTGADSRRTARRTAKQENIDLEKRIIRETEHSINRS